MRRLHPVSRNERFVASGVYLYDRVERLVETWSIHELPDQSYFIRSDRDGRAVDGLSILVEALCHPLSAGWRFERFDVRLLNAGEGIVKEGRAAYTFFADHVEVGRAVNDEPRRYDELPLPSSYAVAPIGQVFGFFVVSVAANNGAPFPVFQHSTDVNDAARCLSACLSDYAAGMLDTEMQTVGGKTHAARCFQYWLPDEPQRKHRIWLDDYGVLLRYDSADAEKSVRLAKYARRPEIGQ